MNLIVVDLEWNSASRSQKIDPDLVSLMRFEIIEVGAVRLSEDLSLGKTFHRYVTPVLYKKIHYHIANVSQPNAAYKIANLEKKGFVRKIRSDEDGRVVLLQVTEKFIDLYGTSERYSAILTKRIKRRFTEEEVEVFHRIMHTLSEELMKEVNQYLVKRANLPKGVLDERANPTI
jgi:hypothetical protein